MCPDKLPEWAELVKTLVKRAKELFGKTGIVWQVWNEIDQSASYADDVALLGPYTRVTAQAIKQIDPTALVIGPPIAGVYPIALPFMESIWWSIEHGTCGSGERHLSPEMPSACWLRMS
jgi:hypothetical protein